MLDKKLKTQFIKEKILKTENEIVVTDLMIGYYEELESKEPKDEAVKKGGYQLKIDQLKQANEFNRGFVEFAKKKGK